ncbi:MAG: hydrogenase small subunit [Desulfobacterales bacterium]|nr:hydrogenase small subunit [Desulfobacterales bacterium]
MVTRRDFLKYSAKLAAVLGFGASSIPRISEALITLSENPSVLWLQGQSCSGCSVSLLNTDDPGPAELLIRYISLQFHSTLSTATGETSIEIIHRTIDKGGYLLAVEGSIPSTMPEACLIGEEPLNELILKAVRSAKGIIAVGTCATFGGIPSAENNPTGAMGLSSFLKEKGITPPVIQIPGCPTHPDWIVGTLVHLLKFGMPELDTMGRPKLFFSKLIHDQCPRFPDYEREHFAKFFGDKGCFFKLGCVGTNTYADCTLRYWNSRINSCIPAGAPCIGCASDHFAKNSKFPFYRIGTDISTSSGH